MNKNTKITLAELIRRKEQMLESKKKPKTATLYIKSLGDTITIESPTADLARDAQDMDNGDAYMVYSCVTEPCLKSKELQTAFENVLSRWILSIKCLSRARFHRLRLSA